MEKLKIALKKSKFTIGLVLLIQSIAFIILFFAQWHKRKSLSAAFLALSVSGGVLGAILIAEGSAEEEKRQSAIDALYSRCFEDMPADDDEFVVPTNETVDESEFN